jgi:pimeloyl-ACP methyl ester carboxylesterase
MRNSVSIFDEVMGRSTPPQGLGDIPLIVLGHGKSTAKTPAQSEWEVTWHTLQSELAALSSEGSYRIVRDAGHMIPIDNPEAVTNAILEMAARIRGSVASAKVK